jgi:hypothetical protein
VALSLSAVCTASADHHGYSVGRPATAFVAVHKRHQPGFGDSGDSGDSDEA